jgi:hypothetical protein
LLRGKRLTVLDLLEPSDKAALAIEEFNRRFCRLSARGIAFVSYRREAYVALEADGMRITFDRHIVGVPYDSLYGLQMHTSVAPVFADHVVFELKYSKQLPRWVRDLVRDYGLQRISFPKYVNAINALHLQSRSNKQSSGGIAC